VERSFGPDTYGRLFDQQTFDTGAEVVANPEFRVTGAIVRDTVFELALEGRLVMPLARGTGAGLLFGVPMAFHLGSIVRLDVGAYTPVVFYDFNDVFSTRIGLSVRADVWIQATDRFWLGPMVGLEFGPLASPNGDNGNAFLGFGLGCQVTHALDFKAMALAYEFGTLGIGAGFQVRID
jgi:hypothetical protein